MATQNQKNLCKAILRNCFTRFNYALPPEGYVFDEDDFRAWSNCLCDHDSDVVLPTGKALGGIVGSAKNAGLVGSFDDCVWLTKAGYELAIS